MARAKGQKRGKNLAPAFVLDNSIVMAWIFEDETDANAEAVLASLASTRAVAPSLWPLEVANALLVGERRKRIAEAKIIQWLNVLGTLPIDIDGETAAHAWGDTIALARGHKLSAYDAAYLELAIRRRLPLATLDGPLKAAAKAVGVLLYDPAR
jgi:predicted nucleic acid-binding protein